VTEARDASLTGYRHHLVLAEQKSQEDYDKALLSLSGGALGVSFVFVDKIVDRSHVVGPYLLIGAWIVWGVSIAAVIASYWCSRRALRCAIEEVDQNSPETPVPRKPGGSMARVTEALNVLAGVLFVGGVILMALFASANLGVRL
jgi:hypothetical protein